MPKETSVGMTRCIISPLLHVSGSLLKVCTRQLIHHQKVAIGWPHLLNPLYCRFVSLDCRSSLVRLVGAALAFGFPVGDATIVD